MDQDGPDDVATAVEGLSDKQKDGVTVSRTSVMSAATMLPTPAKTPRKRNVQEAPALKATARVLFPAQPVASAEALPTTRKKARKGKKYNGFSLDSFTEGDGGEEGQIAIFTDSRDRLPEVDEGDDNPFYVKGDAAELNGSRVSKRRKVSEEVKKSSKVEEALKRDDGMVYVL